MFDEKFRRDGLLVIERMFEPALIERIAATVRGWTGPIDPDSPPSHLSVDARRLHMAARIEGPLLEPAFLTHPILEALLGNLLGFDYLIDSVTVVNALPGAPMMHLHRDHSPLFGDAELGATMPPYAITMVVPLIETDADTGTTAAARASHRSRKSDDGELDPPAEWVAADVQLGGCMLMDYRIWHRGLPNRSSRERPLLYVLYARPWFTDMTNFELHPRMIIDRAALATIDPTHRPRLRRAAAPGLIDATIREVGAGVHVCDGRTG